SAYLHHLYLHSFPTRRSSDLNGLAKSMDLFWNSLQDLATNPTNSGARSVVVQRGIALADTFNYLSNSLTKIDLAPEFVGFVARRSEEHTSEFQSRFDLVCRLL